MMGDAANGGNHKGYADFQYVLKQNENGFSVSVLKKRRRLIELLHTKRN
jgi:beta-galactosidase beta subunit